MTALPWFLLAVTLLVLLIAVVALLVSQSGEDKARAEIEQLWKQQRLAQSDIDEARTLYHRVCRERDLARATVRDLLNAQKAGFRWPLPEPLPMPPDVDDALTTEFDKIVGRHWRRDTRS